MNDRASFELRLAAAFDTYAVDAPMKVDATSLAASIVRRDRHVVTFLGRSFVRPPWLVPVLLTIPSGGGARCGRLRRRTASSPGARKRHQLPPPRTYAGVLRTIGRGQTEPTTQSASAMDVSLLNTPAHRITPLTNCSTRTRCCS
jgi:hypothetical protein